MHQAGVRLPSFDRGGVAVTIRQFGRPSPATITRRYAVPSQRSIRLRGRRSAHTVRSRRCSIAPIVEELRGRDSAGPREGRQTLRRIRGAWIKEQHAALRRRAHHRVPSKHDGDIRARRPSVATYAAISYIRLMTTRVISSAGRLKSRRSALMASKISAAV